MSNKAPITDHLSDDLHFIIACCQVHLSEDEITSIVNYLDSERFEPDILADLASRHGVFPLVYKTLKHVLENSSIGHDTLLADFKVIYMQIAHRNMLMSAELIRMMRSFKEHTIDALSFKGPSLSQIAYGDVTLRQYSDLDILIKQQDKNTVRKILESQGYETRFMLSDVQEKNWYKYAKDLSLFHPKKGIYVELHWLLLDEDYPVQIDLDDIWANVQSVALNGQNIQTFSVQSLLFYLTIHGSKHLWERIEWIKDIDLLIRTQSIEWESIMDTINHSRFRRMVLLGLHLSHRFLETPLPQNVLQQMEHQIWITKLSHFITKDWQAPYNMLHRSLAMVYLFPDMKMKLLYLSKVLFKPTRNEYEFVDLPHRFYWIYYLIRPYLLIKKYLKKE